MDLRNFPNGYIPTQSDLLKIQTNSQNSFQNLGKILGGGIPPGSLTPSRSEEDGSVTISTGFALDGIGRQMANEEEFTVDFSKMAPPGVGEEKWVAVVGRYQQKNRSELLSDIGQPEWADKVEIIEFVLLEGIDATPGEAVRPTPSSGDIIIVDCLIDDSDNQTAAIDTVRRRELSLISKEEHVRKTAFIPTGTIWMYDGSNWQDNKTLIGWYACVSENSDKGCPDMVDRFVMGKGISTEGSLGGANSIILSKANLPSHTHSIDHNHPSFTSESKGASHSHSMSHTHSSGSYKVTSGQGSHYHNLHTETPYYTASGGGTNRGNAHGKESSLTKSKTLPQLNVSGTSGSSSSSSTDSTTPTHTHSISVPDFSGTSGDVGTGAPFENRPAFYSMIFIRKCL